MLGPAFDFLLQASSFVRPTAVCSATFGRDLFLQLLNPYHIISAVNALQAAAQLEVARLIVCVLRDEHLSIDRSVCPFFRLGCCWLRLLHTAAVCYASSRHIITYNAYWLEEVVGPVAQRFGEWVSASRTFSATTDLIAVVQREVGRLCSFSSPCMHAPPPLACLLRLLLTAATFSPQGITTRRGDGAPCRPTLRRRVGVSPGLLV